jgi:hypothetical protein
MVAGGNGEAAFWAATSPDLQRRSGSIPGLPYPPRKQFYSTQSGKLCKRKMSQSGPKRKIPGGLGDVRPRGLDGLVD